MLTRILPTVYDKGNKTESEVIKLSYELEIEATALTAIAEAMEHGENAPEEYAIALHGMAHRLKELSRNRE